MAKRNVSDMKAGSPGGKKLFPIGKTIVKVTWAEHSTSRTGNDRLTLTYEGQVGDAAKQKIRDDLYYDLAQAEWKTKLVTESLGVSEFDPDDPKDLLKTFVNKEMVITVAEDEYTNKEGDVTVGRKITSYESLDPKVAAKQRAEREKRFGSGGGTRADRSASATESGSDDETPF